MLAGGVFNVHQQLLLLGSSSSVASRGGYWLHTIVHLYFVHQQLRLLGKGSISCSSNWVEVPGWFHLAARPHLAAFHVGGNVSISTSSISTLSISSSCCWVRVQVPSVEVPGRFQLVSPTWFVGWGGVISGFFRSLVEIFPKIFIASPLFSKFLVVFLCRRPKIVCQKISRGDHLPLTHHLEK